MGKKRPKRQPKKLSVDVVEAQHISLVDEFGTQRMNLYCTGGEGGVGGSAVVQINGDDGRPRIELQVYPTAASISLLNDNLSTGVSFAVNYDQSNGMCISTVDGKPCIMLGISGPKSNDPRGPHPDITIHDEIDKRFWSVRDGARTIDWDEPTPST